MLASSHAMRVLAAVNIKLSAFIWHHVQGDTKKRELLKNPTKIEEIQEKVY